MRKDCYGNTITTSSDAARDAYDKGIQLFLSGNYGAVEAFSEAVEADPGFALGHAALARAQMMAARMDEAKATIAAAQSLTSGVSKREEAHLAAMATLLAGKPVETRRMVEEHVRTYPRDTLIAQLCTNVFGLIGFSGEVGREAALLAYTHALLPHYGEDWWMMSMHALSLCETGQTDASISLMEKSLAIEPRNAQGSHFKSHAQYEAGDIKTSRAYLAEWMPSYDNRSILHSHLSWHQALLALADGDEAELWDIVDSAVAPGGAKGLPINVLTDTAAIYHRADLAGMKVDQSRWRMLSDYAVQFFPETGQSFADLHAALSHAMAGEGERLAYISDTAKGFAGDLVRPLARAFNAIAHENWPDALDHLTPVMATHERLGGSRAQRDLLELTYVNVLMRLNRTDEARRTLALRRPELAKSPPLATLQSAA
ncbi:MAG: tetratricopeptide repeat protein [Pseudomonadota bacterium]